MSHQIIRTEGVDELVVLPRREFDELLAAAGRDDEAEMRAIERVGRGALAAIEAGTETVLPEWLSAAVLDGRTVLQAAREARGLALPEIADAIGIPPARLSAIERDEMSVPTAVKAKLAELLRIRAEWL